MGFGFPTNLLTSGKSLSKIFLAEIEETVSESVCSSETISFFEIVQAVLLEIGRLSFQCGTTKLPKVPTWSSSWPLKQKLSLQL